MTVAGIGAPGVIAGIVAPGIVAPGIIAPGIIAPGIIAGIGARPGCGGDELSALLAEAAARSFRAPTVLAAPWFRAGATLDAIASRLDLRLLIVDQAALLRVQDRCPTVSPLALAWHGIGAVAEGCALAAAGDGARLLLPRISSTNCTCAIAATRTDP